MSIAFWSALAVCAWFLWAGVCARLLRNPRNDEITGIFWHLTRLYVRWFHGLKVEGSVNIPATRKPGGLIVVANHTAGIDPLLIQAVCLFEVRWMMARDMMHPLLEDFWEWTGVIPVNRVSRDLTSAREALRALEQQIVVGVFPEGRLERPPRRILPFAQGVGMLIARSGAPVLPIVIDGTPQVDPAWRSLRKPSRSRLRVMPVITYRGTGMGAAEITSDLRARFAEWTGWPLAAQSGSAEQGADVA